MLHKQLVSINMPKNTAKQTMDFAE